MIKPSLLICVLSAALAGNGQTSQKEAGQQSAAAVGQTADIPKTHTLDEPVDASELPTAPTPKAAGAGIVPQHPQQSRPHKKDIATIAKEANGAVVSIVMSDKEGHPIVQGTGFLISKDGRVVTNYHVIKTGSSALIKRPDGAFFPVDGIVASDKGRDVAIIKAHGNDFRTLTLGDSARLQVGEEVVAIGNPLSLESTVSNGIVSAIRTVEEDRGKFLQITAPISHGSSGGPLFNMEGEVVGITSAGIKGGENLNFAIPINDVRPVISSVSKVRSAGVSALPDEPENDKTAVGQTNPAVANPAVANPPTNNPPSLDDTVKFLNNMVRPEDSFISGLPGCAIEFVRNVQHTVWMPSGAVVKSVDAVGIKHYELKYLTITESKSPYALIPLSEIDPTSIKSFPVLSAEFVAREHPSENPDALKHPDLSVVWFNTRDNEKTIKQGNSIEDMNQLVFKDEPTNAELIVFENKDAHKDRSERFVTAFVHAVNLCGGKPSDFAPTPRE